MTKQVVQLNFSQRPTTVIALSKAPLEVVGELELAKLPLAVAVTSDSLSRLHPWWVPQVNGISICWINVLAVWEILGVGKDPAGCQD